MTPQTFGAHLLPAGGARFSLWAPDAQRAVLVLDGRPVDTQVEDGWYLAEAASARPGQRYVWRIDDRLDVPDPASRYQPEGVHGPSELLDPQVYTWQDAAWRGRPWQDAVIYELHLGTFTPSGSYLGAIERLDALAELGVTAIELMPLAEFGGLRNWGYDGVLPYAPTAAYGRPEELKQLVDAAHARDLMVLIDVVYNHFGPDGNYLHTYAGRFFNADRHTPWGAAIDFRQPQVREFFIGNALYWLDEYHFDGLRLDAVHAIEDPSDEHLLDELARRVHAGPARMRTIHLVLENDANQAHLLEREAGGAPRAYVAQWNDDLHHVLHHLLTGESDGYYADYAAAPHAALGRALTQGFVYQGEPSPFRDGTRRGTASAHLPPEAFVGFMQNHDQVGNRALGERLAELAPAPAVEAAAAVLLLAPSPPLLFMGEEMDARTPFFFFCDFEGELAEAVREGRRGEFARFAAFADAGARARIPDPNAPETFAACRLDWDHAQTPQGRARHDLYRRLLALRRRCVLPFVQHIAPGTARYAAPEGAALHAWWPGRDGARLELLANLSPQPRPAPVPPFSQPLHLQGQQPEHHTLPPWCVIWSLQA